MRLKFLLPLLWAILGLTAETARVGLPLVPGVLYLDENQEPSGFYLDLFEALAEEENLEIQWVNGSWQQCYSQLVNGEIDILPIAAVTEERRLEMDFLEESVITTWSELYLQRWESFTDVTQIENRRIGLIQGDNNSSGFVTFIRDFGIDFIPVNYQNHQDAVTGLHNQEIYAFVGPSRMDEETITIASAGLHFNAVNSTITFRKGYSRDIQRALNQRLRSWKANRDSPYHELLQLYEMSYHEKRDIPPWVYYTILISILIILFIFLFNVALRRKVKKQSFELLEKEKELHHSDKLNALGHLAGGVAHDFNNMLMGIMGFAELLQNSSDREEQQEYCSEIIETGEKAAQLTQQLLSFARKDFNPMENIDIKTLFESVVSLLKRSLNPKIHIVFHNHSVCSHIEGSFSQFQNALLNLGINAGDAMPKGGKLEIRLRDRTISPKEAVHLREIQVKSERKIEAAEYLEIRIKDSGEGIPETLQNQIFDPYFTTKPQGKGTGLGLAAVLGTITSQKGSIILNSKMGKGTEFCLYLPKDY